MCKKENVVDIRICTFTTLNIHAKIIWKIKPCDLTKVKCLACTPCKHMTHRARSDKVIRAPVQFVRPVVPQKPFLANNYLRLRETRSLHKLYSWMQSLKFVGGQKWIQAFRDKKWPACLFSARGTTECTPPSTCMETHRARAAVTHWPERATPQYLVKGSRSGLEKWQAWPRLRIHSPLR